MPDHRYTADEFEQAVTEYRETFSVPDGESDILLDALRIAASVVRPGVLEAAVRVALDPFNEQPTEAIRTAILEDKGHG